MLYFIKDATLHKYPVPPQCSATHGREQLRDTVPHGVGVCVYCMHRWPAVEKHQLER